MNGINLNNMSQMSYNLNPLKANSSNNEAAAKQLDSPLPKRNVAQNKYMVAGIDFAAGLSVLSLPHIRVLKKHPLLLAVFAGISAVYVKFHSFGHAHTPGKLILNKVQEKINSKS